MPREASDEEIFRAAMADVRRIPEFQKLRHRPSPVVPPARIAAGKAPPGLPPAEELDLHVDFAQTDEYVEWTAPGVRSDLCWAMHRGRIPAQDTLDLHGCTVEAARIEVERFVRQARARGLRCISVVHGRGLRSAGGPVLKKALLGWIETGPLRKFVMACASAPRKQGGAGATFLLLRQ